MSKEKEDTCIICFRPLSECTCHLVHDKEALLAFHNKCDKDRLEGHWGNFTDGEPHYAIFLHNGLWCMARRSHMGMWCAYVWVNSCSKLYKKHYDDCSQLINWDMTYSEEGKADIMPAAIADRIDNYWCVGIDFGHLGDIIPQSEAFMSRIGRLHPLVRSGTYKTLDHVKLVLTNFATDISLLR